MSRFEISQYTIFLIMLCCLSCRSVPISEEKSFPVVAIETELGNDAYSILIELKPHAKVTAYDYFHQRAREIMQKKSYSNCDVLEIGSYDEKGFTNFVDNPDVREKIYGKIKCYK